MKCDNCKSDGASNYMSSSDAEHFANFEEGMEDYIPDSVNLCYSCWRAVCDKEWKELGRRADCARWGIKP